MIVPESIRSAQSLSAHGGEGQTPKDFEHQAHESPPSTIWLHSSKHGCTLEKLDSINHQDTPN
jgi:hypothetical protein